jgi:5-methyltetrahydropteroyltriglutamate--homocysteine methyltransferase
MIRTTVVGSWPVADEFAGQIQRYHEGRLTAVEAEALLTEVAARAIAQQRQCGLDEYTGGETWADNFILHFPKLISGIVPTSNTEAWDGRGTFEVVGPLAAPNGLGVAAAYRRESGIDRAISKVNIPGPSEITMMIGLKTDRAALLPEAIALIRAEMQACILAGAKEVQIDLPHIAMGLVDDEMTTDDAVDIIRTLFAGFTGVRRSIHFCYGDFGAQTWTRNRSFHPLLPTIKQLDGVVDRVVLELSLPEQWQERQLLSEIPASIETALGIVDVKSTAIESVDDLVTKISELMSIVPAERLLICPSCGLGRRNVEMAIGKAAAMVAAVRAVNG